MLSSTASYEQDSAVTTIYSNYVAGLPKTTTITIPNRQETYSLTTTREYDSKYRFVISETSPTGFTETKQHDKFGSITQTTNANEQTISYVYDDFGRLKKTISPLGIVNEVNLKWSINPAIPEALYYTQATSTRGRQAIKYFDKLGRVIYTYSENPEGRIIVVKTEYNSLGNIKKIIAADGNQTTFDYDSQFTKQLDLF